VSSYYKVSWNRAKAAENVRRHGISFDDARAAMETPLTREMHDPNHSDEEDRYVAIGASPSGIMLFIAYTIRNDAAWIISARRATPAEKRNYMSGRDFIRETPETSIYPDYDPADWEYDFTNAVPVGDKFARLQGTVLLDADVYDIFRTDEEVNDALRMLIREGRVPHMPQIT
jgi:uncharacterized DUF497 family protein